MFSVSTSPIIARYLPHVPAITISFWRMCFGAIILWIFTIRKHQIPLKNKHLKLTIIAGIFLGIHFALFFQSIKLTTIANATFLGTLTPLFTFLIEKIFLKKNHSKTLILGLILVILGIIIILGNKFDFSSKYTIGNLYALFCSLFLGISFIISKQVRSSVTTISYTKSLFTSAAITLFIIALITNTNLIQFSFYSYIGLLMLGIIPTILGHGSMYYALRYASPTIVSATPMGEPIIASILAWYLFNEIIEIPILIGGLIILFGLKFLTQEIK
tara:strand:- start:133 stop:951 length:819 start_codon:yes stop_codon:yes gene_type:complete